MDELKIVHAGEHDTEVAEQLLARTDRNGGVLIDEDDEVVVIIPPGASDHAKRLLISTGETLRDHLRYSRRDDASGAQ